MAAQQSSTTAVSKTERIAARSLFGRNHHSVRFRHMEGKSQHTQSIFSWTPFHDPLDHVFDGPEMQKYIN